MPNIATVLKEEIARLARRELRREVKALKKNSAQARRAIAALKRETKSLERKLAILDRRSLSAPAVSAKADDKASLRFSAKGLISQRKRLGFSAADFGKLLGVTLQSIYHWEKGKTRPRREQIAAIAAVRGISKKDALARIATPAKSAKKKKA